MSTRQGIVHNLEEAEYHGGPELSSTGIKTLLHCPAEYAWEREHGRANKDAYDFGHVVHKLILGKGDVIDVIDAKDWRTAKAQDAKKAAYAARHIPILTKDYENARAAAEYVLTHPQVGPLFAEGEAEVSCFHADPSTGVKMRTRFDWLTQTSSGQKIILDVKTTSHGTHPDDLGGWYGTLRKYGYHQQAALYTESLAAQGHPDPLFFFVFVTTDEPYGVRVVDLDAESLAEGRDRIREGIDLFAACTASGDWSCQHPVQFTASIFTKESA